MSCSPLSRFMYRLALPGVQKKARRRVPLCNPSMLAMGFPCYARGRLMTQSCRALGMGPGLYSEELCVLTCMDSS